MSKQPQPVGSFSCRRCAHLVSVTGSFVILFIFAAIAVRPVHAQSVLSDNFNDGNAQDGVPETWVHSSLSTGMISAGAGDLILSGVVVADSFPVIGDTSIRTRVFLPSDFGSGQVFVGVQARRNDSTNEGYSGAIWTANANAIIVREPGGASTILDSGSTNVDVTQQDVMMQFDAIGDELKLWVWRPGEPMPALPQASAVDSSYSDGVISLFSANLAGSDPVAVFREVHVASTHIPEPSTWLLTAIGVACLLAWRRLTR